MRWGRTRSLAAICMTVIMALSGCSKKPVADDLLVRVGDREVRVPEFVRLHQARQGQSPVSLDPKTFLDDLVAREILVQSARKQGLEQDPEVQELIRDVLAAKLKERTLDATLEAVTASDEEVHAAYEMSKAEYAIPERVRLAFLSLRAPADRKEAAQARMAVALSRARESTNPQEKGFGALAVEFSDDQETRYRGGEIGWVERERYPSRIEPKVIDAGFALKQSGDLSEVIEGSQGVYLVKRLDFQPASTAPLEKVDAAVRAKVARKKREQVEAQFLAELRKSIPLEVYPDRVPKTAGAKAPDSSFPPRLP